MRFTDEQILAAIDAGKAGSGGRVHHILSRLTFSMGNASDRPALHRRLRKMEEAGKVHRDPRLSYINSIYWQAGPYPNPRRRSE